MTKNTNKEVRTYCNKVLDYFGLVKCEGSWREISQKISNAKLYQLTREETIAHLTVNDCCISKQYMSLRQQQFPKINQEFLDNIFINPLT